MDNKSCLICCKHFLFSMLSIFNTEIWTIYSDLPIFYFDFTFVTHEAFPDTKGHSLYIYFFHSYFLISLRLFSFNVWSIRNLFSTECQVEIQLNVFSNFDIRASWKREKIYPWNNVGLEHFLRSSPLITFLFGLSNLLPWR